MSVVTLYNAIKEVRSQGHDENWTDTFVSFGRQMVTTSLILTASNIGNIANFQNACNHYTKELKFQLSTSNQNE